MNITFMQTSDSIIYYPMLQETSKTVRRYCEDQGICYLQFVGIKADGNMPWKATYNRIFMLKELLDQGYDGWAFYLDADSYIEDMGFDVRRYLSDKGGRAGIFCGHLHGVSHSINAGGFAINYGHPLGRQLVEDYYRAFCGIDRGRFDLAIRWGDDIPEDQWLLFQVLGRYVCDHSLGELFIFELPNESFVNNGPFIKQILRGAIPEFRVRYQYIRAEIDRIMGALPIVRHANLDPGVAYVYSSHPRVLSAIGTKSAGCIANSGSEEGYLIYGPYITLDPGRYVAKIFGIAKRLDSVLNGKCKIDVSHGHGHSVASKLDVEIDQDGDVVLEVPFELDLFSENVEVRLYVWPGIAMKIFAVKFESAV